MRMLTSTTANIIWSRRSASECGSMDAFCVRPAQVGKERFSEAMEDMKQELTYPLDKFLLPSDSDALTGVRNERASKIGKKGVKSLADHWVSRVTCGVSPPTHVPLELQQVIALESLSEREADMLKIYHHNHWSLASMAGTRQAIELKHSLVRPEP